jgi:phosphoglycolate phosphatase-like HAD superfamily hydrolase
VTPIRAVLLDVYCTLVDLSDSVRSSGFDKFATRLGLPVAPGEFYRRYVGLISEDQPGDEGTASFAPYRQSWVEAGRRLLAPFGREQAGASFADAYADLHATAAMFPDVPDALRALGRNLRLGVVANADHEVWLNRGHQAWPAHLDQPEVTIDNLGQLQPLCSPP